MIAKLRTSFVLLVVMLVLVPFVRSDMRFPNEGCYDKEFEEVGDSSMGDEDEIVFTLDNISVDDISLIQQIFEAFDEAEMFTENRTTVIFVASLLVLAPLVCCDAEIPDEGRSEKEIGDTMDNPLSDDEISYALSDLSVEDLNALSQLIDVLNEPDDRLLDNGGGDSKCQPTSEELARFKRENSDTPAAENQGNSPNIDEDYIRQLDESFPNVVDQSNQDDKEKEHIRVKRT